MIFSASAVCSINLTIIFINFFVYDSIELIIKIFNLIFFKILKFKDFLVNSYQISKYRFFFLLIKDYIFVYISRDIFNVFQNTDGLQLLNNILKKYAVEMIGKVDCVAMLEARGFLLGTLFALYLNVPCIPVRKKGKLPGRVAQLEYSLEYGKVIMNFFYIPKIC